MQHAIVVTATLFAFSVSSALSQKPTASKTAEKPTLLVKYGDGKPDGKKSIAGTGEMIEFSLPNETQKLKGIRVHCSRYGHPKAPDEEIDISIVSHNEADLVHTEQVPYNKFKRGDSRWTTLRFEEPIDVPNKFWVILDFDAQRTKGVYVSYDTETEGKYSKTGVPGGESKAVTFSGDWMVQAMLTKPDVSPVK